MCGVCAGLELVLLCADGSARGLACHGDGPLHVLVQSLIRRRLSVRTRRRRRSPADPHAGEEPLLQGE